MKTKRMKGLDLIPLLSVQYARVSNKEIRDRFDSAFNQFFGIALQDFDQQVHESLRKEIKG